MQNLSFVLFALTGGQGGEGGSGLGGFIPIVIVFAIFYFLLIRPQSQEKKRHEQTLKELKKGDKIVTTGGLHGTITAATENLLKVRIADKVTVQISRSGVASKIEEAKQEEGSGKKR